MVMGVVITWTFGVRDGLLERLLLCAVDGPDEGLGNEEIGLQERRERCYQRLDAQTKLKMKMAWRLYDGRYQGVRRRCLGRGCSGWPPFAYGQAGQVAIDDEWAVVHIARDEDSLHVYDVFL